MRMSEGWLASVWPVSSLAARGILADSGWKWKEEAAPEGCFRFGSRIPEFPIIAAGGFQGR
jgi:hypothetical protein